MMAFVRVGVVDELVFLLGLLGGYFLEGDK